MAEGVRKTLSHAAVYGIGSVISNAASIVMLPIYTRYLTPSDYGLLEYLQMLMDITSIVFGARALTGVFRIYFDKPDEEHRKTVISTSLVTDMALHTFGALLLILLSRPIAILLIGDEAYAGHISLFAVGLVTMALSMVPMVYLRALEKPWAFVTVSVLKLLCQIGFNIYFVIVLDMHAFGVILSTVVTGVLIGGSLATWTLMRTGWRVSREVCMRLLRFGIPFALASIGAFYTTYGDRFFIKHFWNLAEVGLYALAYRFGFALSYLVWGTFNQAWGAQAYNVYREPDGLQTFSRVFLLIMLLLIVAGTALSVLSYDILRVMADPSFFGAAAAIPYILLAYIVRAAGDFCGFGIRYKEETKHFLHASILSVVVMTVGYITLIPRWGGVGAAITTLAGMTVEAWWIVRISERMVPLGLPWRKVWAAGVLGLLTYLLSEWIAPQEVIASIAVRSALLLAFVIVLVFSPIVGADERRAAMRLFGDIVGRLRGARAAP